MKDELILNEKEKELIEAVRNFKKAKHNFSYQLEDYAKELFDRLMYDDEEED